MAKDYIDLHMHSTCSDGTLPPAEVIGRAHASGVGLIALTDHDTMGGFPEAAKVAERLGMQLVPGVEVSTQTHGHNCHLLSYFREMELVGSFKSYLDERLEMRERRFEEMVERFRKLGIELDTRRVREIADGAIARPHVARTLVDQGIVSEMQEAFDKYLANDRPCYVPYEKLETAEVIRRVKERGGVTVVAHPGLDKFTEQEIADLHAAGLDGIEVFHADHDAEARRRWQAVAHKLGLLMTGGSDFHGHNGRENFYDENTFEGGVPPEVREPFLKALERNAARTA